MPTAQKEQTIEQAKEWYSKSAGVVFADYRGLKVKEMQQLRQNLKAKGGELHVVKNTLFRRAAGEVAETLPYEFHNGPTAVAFVYENESDCCKALFDYAQTHKSLTIKGGMFGGRVMDAKGVEALSKLPPRDVLIAQVIGTIVAPLTNLVGVIDALVAEPIRTIYAVADKFGEPTAEAAPEPAAEAAPEASTPEGAEAASAEATPEPEASSESSEAAEAPSAEPAPEAADTPAEAAPEASTSEEAEASSEAPAEEPTN